MTFSSKIDDGTRTVFLEQPLDEFTIADVALDKKVSGIVSNLNKRIKISRIRQLVDIDHRRRFLGNPLSDKLATNEARSASDKNGCHGIFYRCRSTNVS